MANIIFMGTPQFSVPSLLAIHNRYGLKAVVTIPDKPQGRGKKTLPSPVKLKAEELAIPIFQPENLKDFEFLDQIRMLEPDIFVVIAFRILPVELFSIPKIASFNVHASLLPKYRGAAPINWAIINGERTTGLTTFILQEKVDTGNIILQQTIEIPYGSTAGNLSDLMMPEAAKLSIETIHTLLEGNYSLIQQDSKLACPAPKIFPEMCRISWNSNANKISDFINGVSPTPGAWTMWNDSRLKILRAGSLSNTNGSPGSFYIDKEKFTVSTAEGSIEIYELQLQGKRPMKSREFLLGYRGNSNGNFQ